MGMIKRTDSVGLVLGSVLMTLGCSTAPTPATNPDAVRQHADKAFQQLQRRSIRSNQATPGPHLQP